MVATVSILYELSPAINGVVASMMQEITPQKHKCNEHCFTKTFIVAKCTYNIATISMAILVANPHVVKADPVAISA